MSGFFLVQADGSLIELSESPYESEDALQELLARHPTLLAGDTDDPSSRPRWLLVSREAAVPDALGSANRWSVDHLFLDQEGVPTLVEVKRSSDTRIRREVIGQMLDYAANAVAYWPVEAIQHAFVTRCQTQGLDPDEELAAVIGTEGESDTFWQRVKTNLQARRVRMLFVADEIPPELRRVVEFLNEQMDPAEVLALEVRQLKGPSGIRGVAPRVIGRTEQAQQRKAPQAPGRQWDEVSFFGTLEERGNSDEMTVARALLEWANNQKLRIWWGRGKKVPSFVPVLDVPPDDYYPINVSTGFRNAQVQIGFGHMWAKPFDTPEARRRLLERLKEVPGVEMTDDEVTRNPSVLLVDLAKKRGLEKFIGVLNWSLDEVRRVNHLTS